MSPEDAENEPEDVIASLAEVIRLAWVGAKQIHPADESFDEMASIAAVNAIEWLEFARG